MRIPSPRTRLARLGFREPSRAEACIDELPEALHGLVEECAQSADPDTALQMLVRLVRADVDLGDALDDPAARRAPGHGG